MRAQYMINKTELMENLTLFADSVFGCRILAAAHAYGFHEPFAQIWTQDDKAALCKLDDSMVLAAREDADFQELHEFILMSGAQKLLCSAEAAEKISFSAAVSGEVMVYRQTRQTEPPAGLELNPSLREIHALLCKCKTETFIPPEFEGFYLDLSHRIRHEAALSVGIRRDGELLACAVCAAKEAGKAIISAVACTPEHRGEGLGKAAVSAVISQLEQPEIYVFHAQGENEAFYRACGFVPCGGFTEQIVSP